MGTVFGIRYLRYVVLACALITTCATCAVDVLTRPGVREALCVIDPHYCLHPSECKPK